MFKCQSWNKTNSFFRRKWWKLGSAAQAASLLIYLNVCKCQSLSSLFQYHSDWWITRHLFLLLLLACHHASSHILQSAFHLISPSLSLCLRKSCFAFTSSLLSFHLSYSRITTATVITPWQTSVTSKAECVCLYTCVHSPNWTTVN